MGLTYDETMAWGAAQYADVTGAMGADGLRAEFTQTGGMCAAIEAVLDGGFYLLVTDAEDTLPWDRSSHRGLWVGLYPPHESDEQGPTRWASERRAVSRTYLAASSRRDGPPSPRSAAATATGLATDCVTGMVYCWLGSALPRQRAAS